MKLTAWEYRDEVLCPECEFNSPDNTRCLHPDQAQLTMCVWKALSRMQAENGGE
jgi:hypothetical protein